MLDFIAFMGTQEWMVVLLVVLLLFGGTKIPQLMRGVGRGMGELQKGLEEGKRGLEKAMHDEPVVEEPRPSEPKPVEPKATNTP